MSLVCLFLNCLFGFLIKKLYKSDSMASGNFYHQIGFVDDLFIRLVNRDFWFESFLHWLATMWHLQMLQYCQFQVFLFWCQQNPHWFGFHVPNRRWHWPYNFQNWLLKPLLDRKRVYLICLFIICMRPIGFSVKKFLKNAWKKWKSKEQAIWIFGRLQNKKASKRGTLIKCLISMSSNFAETLPS